MPIPFALKRIPDCLMTARKVIFRTVILLLWGILLQGVYFDALDKLTYGVDMKRIRWCGILQRIALSYLVLSLLEIATKTAQATNQSLERFSVFKLYFWQWLVGACILNYLRICALWSICHKLAIHCSECREPQLWESFQYLLISS